MDQLTGHSWGGLVEGRTKDFLLGGCRTGVSGSQLQETGSVNMGREFILLAYRVVFRTPQTKAAHMVYRTYSDKYEECNPVIDAVTDYIADRYIAREDKADDPSPTTRSAHGKEDLVPPAGMSRATFERTS